MKAIFFEEYQNIIGTPPPIKCQPNNEKTYAFEHALIEKARKFPTTWASFMGFTGHFMEAALYTLSLNPLTDHPLPPDDPPYGQ